MDLQSLIAQLADLEAGHQTGAVDTGLLSRPGCARQHGDDISRAGVAET
jgi:hypothetical protein